MKNYIHSLNNKEQLFVNEISQEYSNMLIKNLMKTKGYTDPSLITIRELFEEDDLCRQIIFKRKNTMKKKFYIRMLILGSTYSIIGMSLMVYPILKENILSMNRLSSIGIAVFFSGILMSLFSIVLRRYTIFINTNKIVNTNKNTFFSKNEIIFQWNTIEKLLYDIAISKNLIKDDSVPIGEVISFVDPTNKYQIRNFLKYRNEIAHNFKNNINSKELVIILKNAELLISQLNQIYKKSKNHENNESYLLKTLYLLEKNKIDNKDKIITIYNNLANFYENSKNYEKTEEYLLKILLLLEKKSIDKNEEIVTTYLYLSKIYKKMNKPEKSNNVSEKAIKLFKTL